MQAHLDAVDPHPQYELASHLLDVYTGSHGVAAGSFSVFSISGDSLATLDAGPADGDCVRIHFHGTPAVTLTIERSGKQIDGVASDLVLDEAVGGRDQWAELRFHAGSGSWWRF